MPEKILEILAEDYFNNLQNDSEQCKEAGKELERIVKDNLDNEELYEFEWSVSRLAYEHEKQGFFGGIRFALGLLDSRGSTANA